MVRNKLKVIRREKRERAHYVVGMEAGVRRMNEYI